LRAVKGDRLERLLVVQPRVEIRFVRPAEVGFVEAAGASDASGNRLAGPLDVDAAQAATTGTMDVKGPV